MKKMLPLANPVIKGFLHHAFPFSIIGAYNKYVPWLSCNYLQIGSYQDENLNGHKRYKVDFVTYDRNLYDTGKFPGVYLQGINRQIISNLGIDINRFLKETLNENCYIILPVNEYYTPFSQHFMNNNFQHKLLVFGFDDVENSYNIASYGKNGIYFTDKTISYSDLELAALDTIDKNIDIIQFNNSFEATFDLNLFKMYLSDYLNSTSSINSKFSFTTYGINIMEELSNKIGSAIENEPNIDIRPIHIVLEHKENVLRSIEYIEKNNDLSQENQYSARYHEVVKKMSNLQTLGVKYNISKSNDLLPKISRDLLVIRQIENELLKSLLLELKV